MTKETSITKKDTSVQQFPSLFRSSIWDDFFDWGGFSEALFERGGTPCDVVEIKDDKGEIVANEFTYALAGYDKGNVKIEVDDNKLTISVDKSEETEEQDENKTYVHRGLTRKNMQWSYVLGNKVDGENVTAEMENGVLKVNVPLLPEKEVKQIEVK